jgi:hypothetical protein
MKTENLTSWKKNWLILLHLRKGTSLLDDIFMDCPGKSCLNRIWTSFSAFSTIIYFCTPSVWNDWGPTWLYIMEMGHNQNLMGGGVVQAPLKYTCCNDHPASKFARKPFNWDYKWLSVGLPPRQEAKVFVLEHSSHAEKQADRFQTPNKQMDLFSFPTFFFGGGTPFGLIPDTEFPSSHPVPRGWQQVTLRDGPMWCLPSTKDPLSHQENTSPWFLLVKWKKIHHFWMVTTLTWGLARWGAPRLRNDVPTQWRCPDLVLWQKKRPRGCRWMFCDDPFIDWFSINVMIYYRFSIYIIDVL